MPPLQPRVSHRPPTRAVSKGAATTTTRDPRLVLRIDFPHDCLAGTFVSGRVYVILPKEKEFSIWQGIHVRLEGVEHAEAVKNSSGGIAKKLNPFLVTEQPIVTWNSAVTAAASRPKDESNDDAFVQHLEYPFRWRLPANLPASMQCRKKKKNGKEYCSIDYEMSAFLISKWGEKCHASVVPLQIRSHAVRSSVKTGHAVRTACQTFDIFTGLILRQGRVEIGLELSTDIVAPGTNLRVGIFGSNHCSSVSVKDFVVRLVERVSWTTKGFAANNADAVVTQERILAQEKIWAYDTTIWQNTNSGAANQRRYLEYETLWNMLRIPENPGQCTSSYRGQMIRVEHFVLVIAETSVDHTTNPRCKQAVRLVNASRSDQILQNESAVVLLPTDWEPVVAPILEIPDCLVIPQAQAQVVAANASVETDQGNGSAADDI